MASVSSIVRATLVLVGLFCLMPDSASALIFQNKSETVVGRNGRHDMTPASCDPVLGCFTHTGARCRANPNERCFIQVVPEGRCSGGNTPCVWPQAAGTCAGAGADPVPCLTDDYLLFLKGEAPYPGQNVSGPSVMCAETVGGNPVGQCNMAGNDSSCDCNGVDITADPGDVDDTIPSWELAVCGSDIQSVCSDGDPERFIAGFGVGTCIELCADPTCTPDPGCGSSHFQSGAVFGSKYPNMENPSPVFTLPRRPGSGAASPDSGGPADAGTGTNAVFIDLFGEGPFAQYGIRQIRNPTNGQYADEIFSSGEVSGSGIDNTGPTAWTCDVPLFQQWAPPLPIHGACQIGGAFCIKDVDCLTGICNPSTFEYCHEGDTNFATVDPNHFDSTGFGWSRPLTPAEIASVGGDANNAGTCPPDCQVGFDFTTFEEEAYTNTFVLGDFRIGFQLIYNNMAGARMDAGQVVFIAAVQVINALVTGDSRCYVNGNPHRPNPNDDNIGVCVNSQPPGQSCNPRLAVGANGCSPEGSCVFCGGTPNQANAPHSSNQPQFTFGGNLGWGVEGNARAFPVGYQSHGSPALDLTGRIGRMNGFPSTLEIPFLFILISGPMNVEFGDNDCGAGTDKCNIGQIDGGGPGIGSTFSYFSTNDVIPHDPQFMYLANATVPPENPGTRIGFTRVGVQDFGVGVDGIPGCFGDNNPATADDDTMCSHKLNNQSFPGSTGTDDPRFVFDFSIQQDGSDMKNEGVTGVFDRVTTPFAFTSPSTIGVATTYRDLDLLSEGDRGIDGATKIDVTFCPLLSREGNTLTFRAACIDSDLDGDGWLDEQDGCPLNPNLKPTIVPAPLPENPSNVAIQYMADTGGVAVPGNLAANIPDGIANVCQCGDVTDDGKVNGNDATFITFACINFQGAFPDGCTHSYDTPKFVWEKCNIGAGQNCNQNPANCCNGNDATLITFTTLGLPPGIDNLCPAYNPNL